MDDLSAVAGQRSTIAVVVAAKPVPAALLGRPFTVAEAAALGVTPQQLRGRRFRRLWLGVYVESRVVVDLELRARGLALVLLHGAVFSHHTAAVLLGLAVPAERPLHVSATCAALRGAPRHGVAPHESVPARDSMTYGGLPLTTPARTFLDLAATLSMVDLVVLGDAIVRQSGGRPQLEEAVARAARRRGVVNARRALALLRERVDSPMESRLRLLLVTAGLPCPEVNVPVYDATGGFLGTGDLVYREARVVIEYEGDHHRTDRQQWRDDVYRYERFADAGWLVVRVTADDVLRRPDLTVLRIRRALERSHPATA